MFLFLRTVFDIKNFWLINYLNLNFHFLLIGDSCQYWMDYENQKLLSPYYPQNFFADGNICEWVITAPEGNIILIEFEHFNAPSFNVTKR